jgi:hypothetical protein
MRLGTYTTADTPADDKLQEAQDFLKAKFEAIGGTVRKVMNPHDFGSYPSFEIDYPSTLDTSESDDELNEWHEKADAITIEYNDKYFNS